MLLHVCLRRGLIAATAVALSACVGWASPQPTPLLDYQPESFGARAHAHHFAARPSRTCEAARRALLSQGYVAASASANQVTARKYFQPDAAHHVQLEFKVVCAPEANNDAASMAFVSGLKEQYVMRKEKNSATVGVGGIGSLSLPVEGGLDALVKVSSETVVDNALYERFFALVNEHLEQAMDLPPAPETPASAAAPASVQTPVFVLMPQHLPTAPAVLASQPSALAEPVAPAPAAAASESAASATGGP